MKMKKLVALITASALCLGMSVTAFAADDPVNPSPDKFSLPWITYENNDKGDGSNPYDLEIVGQKLSTAKDDLEKKLLADDSLEKIANAHGLDLKIPEQKAAAESLARAEVQRQYDIVINTLYKNPTGKENLLKAFEDAGYTLPEDVTRENASPEILFAANLKPVDENGLPADIKDVTWRVDVDSFYDPEIKEGKFLYVLHYRDNGTWEVIPAEVKKNEKGEQYVLVQFKEGLSPVGIVKVTSGNRMITLKPNGQAGSVITPPTTDNNGTNNGSNNGTNNGTTNGTVNGNANANTTTKKPTVTAIGKSPKTGEF